MTGTGVMRWMLASLGLGLAAAAAGVYLLWFSAVPRDHGLAGLFWGVTLLSLGLLLAIPAKVYLILLLTGRRGRS